MTKENPMKKCEGCFHILCVRVCVCVRERERESTGLVLERKK